MLAEINSSLSWHDRPKDLKVRINSTFESLSTGRKSEWGMYNGCETYGMLTVSEGKCIKTVIQQAPKEQKEFYIIDIGAGNFQFIKNMVKYINEQNDIRSDIIVNVIGIRGEGGKEAKESIGKCKLYELTAFKIEDIFDEFIKRDFSLEKKIDFVISRWCFRHLNDPLGTFIQTYNLLRPKTGILIIDGFFSLNKNQEWSEGLFRSKDLNAYEANGAMIDLFVRTEAPFLMQMHDMGRSLYRFILQRHNDLPCQLFMRYLENFKTGNFETEAIGSCCITRFDKGIILADLKYFNLKPDTDCLYGAKKLYDWLRKNHIIEDLGLRWSAKASDTESRFQLHQAVLNGSVKEIKKYLKMGNDINEVNGDGYTPLHLAMKEQKMECFKFLLNKGADYSIPSCDITKLYNEYIYKNNILTFDIVVNLNLLWEAEQKGYNENYIDILKNK